MSVEEELFEKSLEKLGKVLGEVQLVEMVEGLIQVFPADWKRPVGITS